MFDAHQDDHTGRSGHGENKRCHPFAKSEGLLGKASIFTTPMLLSLAALCEAFATFAQDD